MTSIDSPSRGPTTEVMDESVIGTRPYFKRPTSPDFKRLVSSATERFSSPFPPDPQTYIDQETHVVLSMTGGLLLLGWYHSYLSAFIAWLAYQTSTLLSYGAHLPAAAWGLGLVGWYKLCGLLGIQHVTYEPGRLQRFGTATQATLWASVPWFEEAVVGLIAVAWVGHLVHHVLRPNLSDPTTTSANGQGAL